MKHFNWERQAEGMSKQKCQKIFRRLRDFITLLCVFGLDENTLTTNYKFIWQTFTERIRNRNYLSFKLEHKPQ